MRTNSYVRPGAWIERAAQDLRRSTHPLHRSSLLVLTPTLQQRPPAADLGPLGPAVPCWLNTGAWVLLALLLSSWILALVVQAIPPVATVYREWPSGGCRTVVTADGLPRSCAQLPPFHDVVWVSASWHRPSPATGMRGIV